MPMKPQEIIRASSIPLQLNCDSPSGDINVAAQFQKLSPGVQRINQAKGYVINTPQLYLCQLLL
ncbi:hypothetical protein VSP9026_03512 [Vibrio spartinae]|uniref:Uncharacterized protein n=1 Tax=Vibrio spartinae TaxID=1918945 RepID=A0A1N6M8U2_9VIBR|nr:hypothetical protein VSP9026_03512 [Vibrio spartinae]